MKIRMSEWNAKELELIRKNEEIDRKSKLGSEEVAKNAKNDEYTKHTYQDRHDYAETVYTADDFSPLPSEVDSFSFERATKIPIKIEKINKFQQRGQSSQLIIKELQKQKVVNSDLQKELENAKSEVKHLKTKLRQETSRSSAEVETTEKEKDFEISSLQRENQELKDQLRKKEQAYKSEQVRLNRQMEEIGQLKHKEHEMKEEFKEQKGKLGSKIAEMQGQVKARDKQMKQLMEAYKKQIELIHVLKQQKLHLETCHVLNFTEEEFLNSINWKPFVDENEK